MTATQASSATDDGMPSTRPTLTRAYSLTGAAHSDPDGVRRDYTIAVRHQRGVDAAGAPWQGALSSHLHTRLAPGAQLDLQAPAGRFTLPVESPQPIVLIAGGIGITPFISQLETIARRYGAEAIHTAGEPSGPSEPGGPGGPGEPGGPGGPGTPPDITLHYANRNSASHAFRERLRALAARLPSLRVIDYYAAPLPGDRFDSGARLSDVVVSAHDIERRARVYLCGPATMMQAVRDGLVARGMPGFDIFHEVFRSPPRVRADATQTHQVRFRRSARTARWHPSSGTLLEFAESLGIALPSGCRVGQCESCAVRVLAGAAVHLDGRVLDDPDVLLGCQAVPVSDIELDA